MIIPTIQLDAESDLSEPLPFIEKIRHWSLFGGLAIRGVSSEQVTAMEQVVLKTSGAVDLYFELDAFSEQDALTLLNAGASFLIATKEQLATLTTVPDERVKHLIEVDTPDQAIPLNHVVFLKEANSERLAELEMARIDALVPIDQLEPELVTEFLSSVLVTDREDGLWSTLIVDPNGVALGLAYSSRESLEYAIENRVGAYYSRSRKDLWIKGETSGATQALLGIAMDCDRDCLRFQVTQDPPGFCHLNTHTCFGNQRTIQSVTERLAERLAEPEAGSFTNKLASDDEMLKTKLLEEAGELAEANSELGADEVTWEAADLLYFSLVAMTKHNVSLADVHGELARRLNRVVRRKNKLESEDAQ